MHSLVVKKVMHKYFGKAIFLKTDILIIYLNFY